MLKRYLIAGLLVWVPLGITFLVIRALVGVMDRTLLLLPPDWRPEALLGFPVPGLGIVLSVLVVLITGMVVANLLGRKLVEGWESLLNRIPLVRSIYSAVKQILETIFVAGGKSFRKVLMVEYPRRGLWTLAFQTGNGTEEMHDKAGHRLVTVFVPTTPNPTSGFIILAPEEDIIELEMSVEDGLKLIMSLGVVAPPTRAKVAPERGNS